ncbi:MAG: hypothetical protein IGBAC_0008 [Ignavibacteriae bacterium]|nr:MAG: hypothetical protein IGBAC_0008 [Ignavibacteriota bacterium]
MKKLKIIWLILFVITTDIFPQIKLISVKGEVKIRKGVSEEWQSVKPTSLLNLEDAISIGLKSTAVIEIDGQRKITLPEQSIVEISDLRELSKDELLLKLAMDRILAVPQQDRKNDLIPAPSAVIHGEKKSNSELGIKKPNHDVAIKTLNGAKFLYGNNYYGTCALRIKEVLRLYPDLPKSTDYKIMTALALEKAELYEEALNELYLLDPGNLTAEQKSFVQSKIEKLKKKFSD